MTKSRILSLENFDKLFEVDYDVSYVSIGSITSQVGKLIASFSENWKMQEKSIMPMIYNVIQLWNNLDIIIIILYPSILCFL